MGGLQQPRWQHLCHHFHHENHHLLERSAGLEHCGLHKEANKAKTNDGRGFGFQGGASNEVLSYWFKFAVKN